MNRDITIKKCKDGSFEVWEGNRYSPNLTYDEVLGVVATLCMSCDAQRIHKSWLKTESGWKRYTERMGKIEDQELE